MIDITTVLRAAETAAQWHAGQRRKGAQDEPYVNHLIEVAALVARADGSEQAIVAAFLHDAVEDQTIAPALIGERFGAEVVAIVLEVTDDKSLPKEVRKTKQVETAAGKSMAAKLVKLADKIANVRSVTRDPPRDWPVERQHAYVDWCGLVVAGLRGASPMLEAEFDEAVERFWNEARPAITDAVPPELRPSSPAETLDEVRRLGLHTPNDATATIRADRDAH